MFAVMESEWDKECSRPLKPHSEDDDGSRSSDDSNRCLHSENNSHKSSSSDHSSKDSDIIIPAFDLFAPSQDFRALPSSTSSSSATSSDDLFQVIPATLIKPHTDIYTAGKLDDRSQALSKDYISSDSSAKSNESEYGSSGPASSSTVSDITHESTVHTLSPTQSPPVQMMDRSGGFDPYRIPSSVFERSKSSTPVEWSVASNDSLFSIHIGNNSFSRDHVIMWGSEQSKPEELPKSSELIPFSPPPPGEAVMVVSDDDATAEVEKIFKANQRSVGFVQENDDGRIKEKTVNNTAGPINSSRHSDESGTSTQSFSFPILTEADRSDPVIKIDTQKYRQQLPYQQPYVQNPAYAPTSRSYSKRCCGSCRSSCCCYSSCCSWRSCCSWWSCCSWRSCCSCRSCSSCTSCFSCRSCRSCFSCGSCRSCCSCSSCNATYSCHPWRCCSRCC
ncbi:lisH domain-containing protein C1711.05 isoform X4 [Punica granatum]|uniref:LisH domain-containing protein C1711.05 isoform X4 n=1 Tax=Punica granatum TaxID=22663 RepID=A0A6P8DSF5_PUNGR|nr:lisH domain-containing protein C1711.05 isoform X4 [Punica granatum]